MANILFVAKGTGGDLVPFPKIGAALKQRGHRVILLSHCSYEGMAKQNGWDFIALDTPDERERIIEDGQLLNRPAGYPTYFRRHILPGALAEYKAIQKCCHPGNTLLVTTHKASLVPLLAAERLGIPLVRMFATLSELITLPLMEGMYRDVLGGEVNAIRETVGLQAVTDWGTWLRKADREIALWPEWFAAPDGNWPVEAVPVGFIQETGEEISAEVLQTLQNGEAQLLITAGTGLFTDPRFYSASAEACRLLDRRAILVTRYPQLIPDDLPEQVLHFNYLPFAGVMPHMRGIIHHGGVGTLACALSAGVPQLVLASGGDRPENGRRIQHLGVGEYLLPSRWQPEIIASALERLLDSPSVREQCQVLAGRLRASDAAADACKWIESVLPLAGDGADPSQAKIRTIALDSKAKSAELIQQLSPEKQALLAQRLREKNKNNRSQNNLRQPRKPGINTFPLSFAQERLWILDQLTPGSAAYNVFSAVRLRGQLDVSALEQGFKQIVQRHESLRTTFQAVDGQPYQVILPSLEVALPVVDVSAFSQSELQQMAREEAQLPFDLSAGPLMRCRLLRPGQEEHILLLTMHHIISDGWSLGALLREVVLLGQAFAAGHEDPLPALPIQYADFAVWQRNWLQGEVLEEQLGYWKQQMAGAPAALELLTDHARPAVQTNRGSTHTFKCSPALTQALRALSQRKGVTLFMTLLAAFQVLLSRYSGQSDIVVGSPHANRSRSDLENLIGFFANTLVLRTDLSGDPSFAAALQRVRDVTMGAHGHQDLPFEKLVDELQVPRDLSRNPLFQVMFILQNTPRVAVDLLGLTMEPYPSDKVSIEFDLTFSIIETNQGLNGYFDYNTDLFESQTIERMIGHLQTLLAGIVADPEQRLSQLPLLDGRERRQLVEEWNATEAVYPAGESIQALFEAQVKRTPQAPAVIFEQQRLTYHELNERANQLAHFLIKQGVGPDVLVGICVERSLEMVIGLLGILKAGGAYVPLDPGYPKERLAYMLQDSGAALLLTQERLVADLPEHRTPLVRLDADWGEIEREKAVNPGHRGSPDNLAYVIYTSGSTGRPKGVQVLHGGVVNFLASMEREPGLVAADRLLSVTTLSFDIAGLELYLPLMVGAQVEVVSHELASDGFRLRERLKASGATIMQATPATWRLLLDAGWEEGAQLKVLCGGEALSPVLADALLPRASALWNMYGPTETTIWSSVARIERAEGIAPIGRPIANTQMYVLDGQLNPVPVGVAGELYIGGDGLARGYLNRPDLTAEMFVPDPFSAAGARMYRTGDLVRWLGDGQLEYLRRIDQQVKVRGFRIELGEIEMALGRQAGVQEAVLIVREDQPGDKRLVAYVVLQPDVEAMASELRAGLKASLPEYMLPSAFVFLEQLPLTPNGKIDRKVLPAPDQQQRGSMQEYVAPQTEAEATLAEIWKQVLNIEQVGIHDNFFELGGDSLLAMRVVAQANKASLYITPRQIFQHQRLAELATLAQTAPKLQTKQEQVTGTVPLTNNQHWLLNMNFFDVHHWNISSMVIVPATIDLVFVERAILTLLEHHDALRTRFVYKDSGWQAFIVPPDGKTPFFSFDFSELPVEDHKTAIEQKASELQGSFNISEGPVVRVAHFNLGPNVPGRLLFIVHHLVADGSSLPILIQDFQTAYTQLSYAGRVQLPAKTTSIKDVAERLENFAKSAELRTEVEYWLSLPWEHTPLPLDFPRMEANTEGSIRIVEVSLTAEETNSLLRNVPKIYNTRIMDVLIAALVYAVTRWSGGDWTQVTILDSGRNVILADEDIDLSRTVGLLVSSALTILKGDKTNTIEELLVSIKEQLRRIPHQGNGYELLLRCSGDPQVVEQLKPILKNELKFNYAGQFDNLVKGDVELFQLAPESCGPSQNMENVRGEILYVLAAISGGRLSVTWWYSENLHKRATIERVANDYIEVLRALIARH